MTTTLTTQGARPLGAPVIDWEALATLTGAAYERAMDAVTGVRCEPDVFGMATGDQHARTGTVEYPTAPESLPEGPVTPHVHTMRDAISDALRLTRVSCPDVATALVLTAALHGDVVSASGRIVGTRLALALGLPDDAAGSRIATDALALALGPIVAHLADMLDNDERPARRVVVTPVFEAGHVRRATVTVDYGASRERDGLRSATTSAMRRALRAAQVKARPTMAVGRILPVVLDPNGYTYRLCYSPVSRLYGPVTMPPKVARALAFPFYGNVSGHVGTSLTRGLGDGHGTDVYGNRTRDALGRVSLASGATMTRERLAGRAVGGSYVLAAPNGTTGRRAAAKRERVERDAPVTGARDALAALRARMGR